MPKPISTQSNSSAKVIRQLAEEGVSVSASQKDESQPTSSKSAWPLLPALGIDYGTVHIGLALAATPIVQPLVVIPSDSQALTYLGRLIDDYQIRTIVVGLSERRSAEVAATFAHQLKHTFGPKVTVVTADETMSTQVARHRLASIGKKIGEKERIDHYAAAYILEEWIDENV